MLKTCLLLFVLCCEVQSFSQVPKHGPPCGGMDIVDAGIHVSGYTPIHDKYIYSISAGEIKKGFKMVLSDTSYKILSLLLSHAQADKVFEYPIKGNMIDSKKANFLSKIKAGDTIIVDCVNICRDGKVFLSTGIEIIVIE